MKRHPYLLLLLTTLCFSACTHEKTKDFKQYPATELTFEEIRIDSIMDYPRQLRIAGDSLLIINDHVEDKAVLLYNLSDSSCVRTVSIGQGPSEVLAPNWIDLAGDSLNVLSRSNGKINRYALNDLLQDKITACRTIDLKDADRFVQTDYGYIGMDFYLNDKEEVRLARAFDLMGNPVQDLDWYTEYQADDKILTYFCFQGQAGYHPGSLHHLVLHVERRPMGEIQLFPHWQRRIGTQRPKGRLHGRNPLHHQGIRHLHRPELFLLPARRPADERRENCGRLPLHSALPA